ncbi:hypothetical protein [Butyricimonas virosa]|jgi:hypothetical protein|uniref:hypothetical protein n=1 Tax=Butyricimonas virosa TaxID=544645 RepID=UPI002666553F|nr:hypothetical protein [Butyricimonas virosa]
MAEFVNSIGQVRGKFGNVVAYVRANGKNYCKGASISRKPSTEPQKQQTAAFAVVVSRKGWMARAIRLGFPGNQYPKGFNGFTSANVTTAVTVEKVNPAKPIVRYKKATQEYRGIIDYSKLRVAAGALVSPVVVCEVESGNRKVHFSHQRMVVEAIDCFLDDEIYGVLLHESTHSCKVMRLGMRGEDWNESMDFPEEAEMEGLVVYVFARAADGKDTSDSECLWSKGK